MKVRSRSFASPLCGAESIALSHPTERRSQAPSPPIRAAHDAKWGLHLGGGDVVPAIVARLARALAPPPAAAMAPRGLLSWPAPLLGFQRDGAAALVGRRNLLLADDMGLGKTIQAIAALRILYLRREINSALVVCPASLLAQWRKELARWAPELRVSVLAAGASERASLWRRPAHVRVIGYDTLRSETEGVKDSPALRETWGVVVLDEASKIKNRDTAVSRSCKQLRADRRWALTGTPLENRIDDAVSILDFVAGRRQFGWAPPYDPVKVRLALSDLQIRRRKAEVLTDLPPKTVHELAIELTPAQREAYDRAETEAVHRLGRAGSAVTVTHILELITRLKQICNVDPGAGESSKLDDIAERLDALTAEGHRALVFSQFTDGRFGVGWAATALARFRPMVYTGAMSGPQKDQVIAAFTANESSKVLVMSVRAGGMGLNLQCASYVFHLDRWWNPSVEEQAEARSHRMGQRYPVTAIRYICRDTVEERIHEKLQEKRALFAEVVDAVSLDLSTVLTEQELFGLFGLEAPGRRPA